MLMLFWDARRSVAVTITVQAETEVCWYTETGSLTEIQKGNKSRKIEPSSAITIQQRALLTAASSAVHKDAVSATELSILCVTGVSHSSSLAYSCETYVWRHVEYWRTSINTSHPPVCQWDSCQMKVDRSIMYQLPASFTSLNNSANTSTIQWWQ